MCRRLYSRAGRTFSAAGLSSRRRWLDPGGARSRERGPGRGRGDARAGRGGPDGGHSSAVRRRERC